MGDRFVEGNFRRPLRDGVVAFRAFVEANLRGENFVALVGGAFDQQIGQSWSSAGIDDRRAIFLLEFLGVFKLFRLEGIASQV